MRVEMTSSECVRAFWGRVWGLVAEPAASLSGLGCFMVALTLASTLALIYRLFPSVRRAIMIVLVAMWLVVTISLILLLAGGG